MYPHSTTSHVTYLPNQDRSLRASDNKPGRNDYLVTVLDPRFSNNTVIPDGTVPRSALKQVTIDQSISATDFVIIFQPYKRQSPILLAKTVINPSTGVQCLGFSTVILPDDTLANWRSARLVSSGLTVRAEGVSATNLLLSGRFNATPIYGPVEYDRFNPDKMAVYNAKQSIQGSSIQDGIMNLYVPTGSTVFEPVLADSSLGVGRKTTGVLRGNDLMKSYSYIAPGTAPTWVSDPIAGAAQTVVTLDAGVDPTFTCSDVPMTITATFQWTGLGATQTDIGMQAKLQYINALGAYADIPEQDLDGWAVTAQPVTNVMAFTLSFNFTVRPTYPVARILFTRNCNVDPPLRRVFIQIHHHSYYDTDHLCKNFIQLEAGAAGQTYGVTGVLNYEALPTEAFMQDVAYADNVSDTVDDYNDALKFIRVHPLIKPLYTNSEYVAIKDQLMALTTRAALSRELRAMDWDGVLKYGREALRLTSPLWQPALDSFAPGVGTVARTLLGSDAESGSDPTMKRGSRILLAADRSPRRSRDSPPSITENKDELSPKEVEMVNDFIGSYPRFCEYINTARGFPKGTVKWKTLSGLTFGDLGAYASNFFLDGDSRYALILRSANGWSTSARVPIKVSQLVDSKPVRQLAWMLGDNPFAEVIELPGDVVSDHPALFATIKQVKGRRLIAADNPASASQIAELMAMIKQLQEDRERDRKELEGLRAAARVQSSGVKKTGAGSRSPMVNTDLETIFSASALLSKIKAYAVNAAAETIKPRAVRYQNFPIIALDDTGEEKGSVATAIPASLYISVNKFAFQRGTNVSYQDYNNILSYDTRLIKMGEILRALEDAQPNQFKAFMASLSKDENGRAYITLRYRPNDNADNEELDVNDTSYAFATRLLIIGAPDGLFTSGSMSDGKFTKPGYVDLKKDAGSKKLIYFDPSAKKTIKDVYQDYMSRVNMQIDDALALSHEVELPAYYLLVAAIDKSSGNNKVVTDDNYDSKEVFAQLTTSVPKSKSAVMGASMDDFLKSSVVLQFPKNYSAEPVMTTAGNLLAVMRDFYPGLGTDNPGPWFQEIKDLPTQPEEYSGGVPKYNMLTALRRVHNNLKSPNAQRNGISNALKQVLGQLFLMKNAKMRMDIFNKIANPVNLSVPISLPSEQPPERQAPPKKTTPASLDTGF